MKKLIAYALLLSVFILNGGAGCGGKKTDDPQPAQVKLLVGGLWDVTRTYTVTPSDKITLTIKKGALGLKFYSDGKIESCSSGTCGQLGRWSFQLISNSAGTGTLTVYVESTDIQAVYGKKLEGALDISTDNLIRWIIKGNPVIGETDASEIQWTMERTP
ncbi:hypothetical protein [Arsenicibacter rosenii]|uniref:Lipocalin-like domain-containing protein n=1 Tax=Arsenicibacter rosenii TaxID=1750698 RepID=A0A1S2VBH9_9BACT|nr:hypothetical protein [Arsenicibacter rosenii]OIN56084.1 hypothetical protein BLX24_26875 [Arsenicibacter rosenii]